MNRVNLADREMIPAALLRGIAALVIVSLGIVTFGVLTDRPHVGRPEAAATVAERMLVLRGGDAQSVRVETPDGAVLADLAHGGFVTVVQSALAFQRKRHGIDPAAPVRLVEFANGRLAVEDPATGWSVELYAFGGANEASWRRLLPN